MLLRTHDGELDQLMRQNRQSQEKLSSTQVSECKALQKKLKAEQVYSCYWYMLFSGRLLRVDLIQWVSNVCPSVRPK